MNDKNNTSVDTKKVDIYHLETNMYGCLPCPKCNSKFRVPYLKSGMIECDDCGYKEVYYE